MGNNADKRARQRENRATAPVPGGGPGRRRGLWIAIGVAVLALVALAVVLTRGGDEKSSAPTTTDVKLTEATPCPPAQGSAKRVQSFAGPPPTCIDPAKTYTATFETSEGTFTAQLDAASAPITVNNFVVLARYHYFDDTTFHRIVPGFVIQGGDGDGVPDGSNDSIGYTIPDELPASSDAYADFTLAMANAGPDTGSSQFFVVLPGGGSRLGPQYSLFGKVTEGTDVVERIGKLGDENEKPTRTVTVKRVTIDES